MYKGTGQNNKAFLRVVCFAFLHFMAVSCSQNRPSKLNIFVKTDTVKAPVVVAAGMPVVVQLDTCPPPYYVVIPIKDSIAHVYNTSKGPWHVKLAPPSIVKGDFFLPLANYNDEKGLGINSIMTSFCDKKGNLWFGTNGGGLTRYNGKTSVTFTAAQGLGNNQPRCIAEDKDGNIWFVMGGGGVAKYDGRLIHSFTSTNGLAHNEVRTVVIDNKGDLWFGTDDGGISCYDGKKFRNYTTKDGLASNRIECSIKDKSGKLWFGTADNGVSCYNGNRFVNYTTEDGLISNSISSILEDRYGNIWIGTDKGVSKYSNDSFANYTAKDGLANSIHSIVEDDSGNLWFGTYGGGVCCFNGKSFFSISKKQGLSNNIVRSIVKDKKNNLWFGTFGAGVDCYSGRSIVTYTTDQGLPDLKVWGITEDSRGNMWFGTDSKGICKYDGEIFTHFSTSQGLYNGNVHCLFEDNKGLLWIGTNGGVSCYDGKSFTTYTTRQGLAGMRIRDIIQDKEGSIWFASESGGVSKFDGKKFLTLNKTHGLADNDVRAIYEDDKGRIWFGTHGGGISCYTGNSFINFSTEQGLANNFIFEIIEDKKGNLWVATGNNGLSILRKEKRKDIFNSSGLNQGVEIFENFTTIDGLANDAVYDIAEDKEGNIIIGTNFGLTVIKGGLDTGGNKIRRAQIENYNLQTGYPIKDANSGAMFSDSRGIVWVGTGQKLVRFDYAEIKRNFNPLEVCVQNIKINNENIAWYNLLLYRRSSEDSLYRNNLARSLVVEEAMIYGAVQGKELRDSMQKKFADIVFDSIAPFYPLPVGLKLPYKHNTITFDFAAIEPARSAQVRYQYKLENYDNDWNPVSSQSTATFGNINEGSYTFKVKAQSPDGIWSEPVEYSFKVLPPFWRTGWFTSLCFAAIGAFLFFGIRYRVSSVRRKEQEKAKHEKDLLELEAKALRAQMNPHFVFNCLNSIKSLMQEQQTEKGVTYLTTFSKLIRTLFNNADKKEITLYDEIETCKLYLQLEAMRFDTKFSYAVNVDDSIDLKSVQVPALIIQPFIENAIWHGIMPRNNGGRLSLNVSRKNDAVEIVIEDDGIGREASRQNKSASTLTHQSKGVNLTQARLELDNLLQQRQASLETIDKKDESGAATGTKVIITIKEEI